MDPATIALLITGVLKAGTQLAAILTKVHNGVELTDEEKAVINAEHAAAKARLDADLEA